MPASTFGYREDCGYPSIKNIRLVAGSFFAIFVLIAVGAWFAFKTPQQEEAFQKKLCQKSGGRLGVRPLRDYRLRLRSARLRLP